MESSLLSYLIFEWQPIIIMVVGLVLLGMVAWANWVGSNKSNAIRWISKNIYRSKQNDDVMGEGIFMNLTTWFLVIGLLCIIISAIYLSHGAF